MPKEPNKRRPAVVVEEDGLFALGARTALIIGLVGPDIRKKLHVEFHARSISFSAQRPISGRQKSSERGGPDMLIIGCGEQLPCRSATQLSPKQACST